MKFIRLSFLFLVERGCSSVGRAPALHAGGHRFESGHLHQFAGESSVLSEEKKFCVL